MFETTDGIILMSVNLPVTEYLQATEQFSSECENQGWFLSANSAKKCIALGKYINSLLFDRTKIVPYLSMYTLVKNPSDGDNGQNISPCCIKFSKTKVRT